MGLMQSVDIHEIERMILTICSNNNPVCWVILPIIVIGHLIVVAKVFEFCGDIVKHNS
jgi:hypothetical protein